MAKQRRFGDLGFKFDDVQEWVALKDLLEQEITVLDFLKVKGDFGYYAIVKFVQEEEGVIKATSTGAKVILEKLELAKEKELLPMVGKIVKVKNWFDIR